MNRRHFLAAGVAALALAATGAARASDGHDYVEDIVDWLEDAGYTDISLVQSLLGRFVITAHLGSRIREIACNPRTGEILRDVWLNDPSGARPPALPDDLLNDDHGKDDDDNSGKGSGGDSGHGSSNSGHGSSNSGSGGGGDDDDDDH